MNREIQEHIYFKNDIDKAFNMGIDTALSIFEKTIGMTHDNQRLLLQKVKNKIMEDNAEVVSSKR